MISAMAVPSFMAIPSPRPAVAGVGLLPIVGTGFYQSVKRGVRLAREVLICVPCLKSPGECVAPAVLLHKDPSCPGLTGASSTPRLLDSVAAVSGILGRPVKPGDDARERGAFVFHDKPPR